ncbi:MAG: IS1634 family transposase [Culicoidibacterales bacterium]
MYLKKAKRSSGRIYLSINKSVRKNGQSKTLTIKSLGYLDELEKEFADPIAHFTQIAADLTAQEKQTKKISIDLDMSEKLSDDADDVSRIGDIVFSKLYHQLKLHELFLNRARPRNFKFIPNNIMKTLVMHRIFSPSSKRHTYLHRDNFFEHFNFSLDDMYHSLDFFAQIKHDVISHLNSNIPHIISRDTSICLYDVTNYYFEIDNEDETGKRKRGASKENKRTPIIQMGLATDKMGIPLTYELFAGNTHDSQTFQPIFRKLKKDFATEKIIICADKGLNSADNMVYATNGYVIGERVAGGSKELQQFIFAPEGYSRNTSFDAHQIIQVDGDYTFKSRKIAREVSITTDSGRKKKVILDQKQIVFWSHKYAKRAKAKREEQIVKAQKIIDNPSNYRSKLDKGALSFINQDAFNADGEIIEGSNLSLNHEKIKKQERFDGFYMIVTSEHNTPDTEVIDMYRGLWKIEETFRVTKSSLEARPIFLRNDAHIEAHFLSCYISLTLIRMLEAKLAHQYSAKQIIDELGNLSVTYIKDNIFKNNYTSKITRNILEKADIDLSRKFYQRTDLRQLFADVKKIYD